MADFMFGLSLSSFIALFLGINKKWRVASKNGLHNSVILLGVLTVSFIIFGETNNSSSSGAIWGILGIGTFPLYIFANSMLRRQARHKDSASNIEQPMSKHSINENLTALVPAKLDIDSHINKSANIETPAKNKETALAKKTQIVKDEDFPDWYVSISFGKSRSENFPQAIGLAKMAPKYLENPVEGKTIYQAVYSSKTIEYLAFAKLYELVSAWKSCFVVINGHMVDRKTIGGLNYCYGDRCRSGNPEFCYGASYMTENPFGCHRIQISVCNNPWWTFGRFDNKGVWHVDKEAMLKRIIEYSEPYRLCPAFSIDNVLEALKNLPDKINPKKDKNWLAVGSVITPARSQTALEFTVKVNLIGNEGGIPHDRT